MNISIVTLNYNGAESTIKLLESLRQQTDSEFLTIVADNNSTDIQQLRDYVVGKNIELIENGSNLGFGAGNKPGVMYAFDHGADFVILLNNDTTVEAMFVADLKNGLAHHAGLVGMPIQEEGGEIAYSGRLRWLQTPTRRSFHVYDAHADVSQRYIIGAGMAISREAFQKVGSMDEKYFLYFEDIDYSYRAVVAGIQTSYLKKPLISHQLSTTTKKELGGPMIHRYHYRNALYFNRKNGSVAVKLLVYPWSWIIVLKQLIKITFGIQRKKSRAILAAVGDFYAGRMGRIIS